MQTTQHRQTKTSTFVTRATSRTACKNNVNPEGVHRCRRAAQDQTQNLGCRRRPSPAQIMVSSHDQRAVVLSPAHVQGGSFKITTCITSTTRTTSERKPHSQSTRKCAYHSDLRNLAQLYMDFQSSLSFTYFSRSSHLQSFRVTRIPSHS